MGDFLDISINRDLKFTEDGDLELFSNNDNSMRDNYTSEVTEVNLIIQNIKHRIKSVKIDWFYDHIGADLEQILGMENSKETATLGSNLIKESLTFDGYIKSEDIYIKPTPTDIFSISYLVAVKIGEDSMLQFKVFVALNSGINVEELI